MASTLLSTLILFCFILVSLTCADSHVDDAALSLQIAVTDDPEWAPSAPSAPSLFDHDLNDDIDDARRSLFWRRTRYYISYGALSANRVPCRPRSGRSYYTHNCHIANGPAHPYTRGCSTITRCSR